jgi:hypothetical protein
MALIVVDTSSTGTLSVYDGDDPSLPLWKSFSAASANAFSGNPVGNYSCVFALNGRIYLGKSTASNTSAGLVVLDFASDVSKNISSSAGSSNHRIFGSIVDAIAAENRGKPSEGALVDSAVNDISATILEGAEIGALGLPEVTTAVATNGGVSVIHANGEVYDIDGTGQTNDDVTKVFFTDDGMVGYTFEASSGSVAHAWALGLRKTPYADGAIGGWTNTTNLERYTSPVGSAVTGLTTNASDYTNSGAELNAVTPTGKDGLAIGYADRLSIVKRNTSNMEEGAVAYITSTYNTGYMVGDIRLAALSDSDSTDLVGTELVTNGDFASDISGWTAGNSASLSLVSNTIKVEHNGTNNPHAYRSITTVIGDSYTVSFDGTNVTAGENFRVVSGSSATSASPASDSQTVVGSYSYTFVATSTTTIVKLQALVNAAGEFANFDNVSVRLADVDRSVKNNGLATNGTVTKTAVATSAELMAYSGFSASNYLSQAYDADFDFGTGDFSIMYWVKTTDTTASEDYVSRADATATAGDWTFEKRSADNTLRFYRHDGSGYAHYITSTSTIDTNWKLVCLVKRSSVLNFYINGQFESSLADTLDYTPSGGSALVVGRRLDTVSYAAEDASLSLLRISATAPTPKQIADIYAAEKPLFAAGAKCLLQSNHSSLLNQVNDLSFDKQTGVLSVAQPASSEGGVNYFRGLELVGTFNGDDHGWSFSSTDNVATNGGIIAANRKSSTGGVLVDLPAIDVRADLNEDATKLPDDGKLHFEASIYGATPTIIGVIPMAEGETYLLTARVFCKKYVDGSAAIRSVYVIEQKCRRPIGGNTTAATVLNVISDEGTASMNAVFSGNTSNQTIELTVTGVAAIRSLWKASVEVQRISEKTYER